MFCPLGLVKLVSLTGFGLIVALSNTCFKLGNLPVAISVPSVDKIPIMIDFPITAFLAKFPAYLFPT